MTNIIFVEKNANHMRAVLVRKEEPQQLFEMDTLDAPKVGAIYAGRVKSIHQSPKAAFVEIEKGEVGFLPLPAKMPVHEGQMILVQVTRDAIEDEGGIKQCRLTTDIALRGKLCVFVPLSPKLKISKKIPLHIQEQCREALSDLLQEPEGLILRTFKGDLDHLALGVEVAQLRGKWNDLQNKLDSAKSPTCLLKAPSLLEDLIATYPPSTSVTWIVNERPLYNQIAEINNEFVELHRGKDSLFQEAGLLDVWEDIKHSQVSLLNGGNLVIEKTSACTTIDVNSSGFKGKDLFDVNKQAAVEAAQQITLRNLSGAILIDFLKMKSPKQRAFITQFFKSKFAGDSNAHVHGFTALGFFELSRQASPFGIKE